MKRKSPFNGQWTIIKIIFLTLILIMCCTGLSESKHRIKRKVLFSKSSKFFFRLNGKDNVLNHTEIFAHGWSIRMNWDLPESMPKRYKFFKRDVHDEIENISNKFAAQGFACIARYLCETITKISSSPNCGMFCQIGSIINRSQNLEADYFKKLISKCDYYSELCVYPLDDKFRNFI